MTDTTAEFRGGPLDGQVRQVNGAASIYEVQLDPRRGTLGVIHRVGVYLRGGRRLIDGRLVFEYAGSREGGVR